MKNLIERQIDEIWMEFCCEEKFTAKQEFVETETKKYEFEEETEIVEDFGKVNFFSKPLLACYKWDVLSRVLSFEILPCSQTDLCTLFNQ